jgi:aminoglycoside phosphotransferase (APT) family kinase protein
MREPGELLASGRDADIFECGPGLVLRRSRNARSLAAEARVMTYLHEQGYPVPRIEEISGDGRDLVMERVDGPSLADWMSRRPWALRRGATMLADLHKQLHSITAPDFLPPADVGEGDQIAHMDLHPLNVIVGKQGPVVIDWARTGRGDGMTDVTIAWMLSASAAMPATGVQSAVVRFGRWQFATAFAHRFDVHLIAERASAVAEWKAKDANMSGLEIATMRRLAAEAAVTR